MNGIEATNIDLVLRKLAELEPKKWRREVMKEMRKDHKGVRSTMRSGVPVGEGKLRKSIRTNSWVKRRPLGEVALFVRTGPRFKNPGRVYYAHFVELGTANTPAAHFVQATKNSHESRLIQGIKDAIGNVAKKFNK